MTRLLFTLSVLLIVLLQAIGIRDSAVVGGIRAICTLLDFATDTICAGSRFEIFALLTISLIICVLFCDS